MKSKAIVYALAALGALVSIGLCIWLISDSILSRPKPPLVAGSPELPGAATEADIVMLTAEQLQVAGIRTQTVTRQTLQMTRTLPARFAYDDARHVSVRTPSEGVLQTVLVKTGDQVAVGQSLATIRSPALGDARSRVLTSETNLALAEKAHQWEADIQAGVEQLVELIREGEPVESIKATLHDKTLGNLGGQLLTKYSKSELASKIARSMDSVGSSGAISGRVVQERISQQQQSLAELEASIEQTRFQAKQSLDRAAAAEAAAQRDLQIAQHSLATLLGSTANVHDGLDVSASTQDLSMLTIRAPIAGTVERKVFSATERVTPQAELFVIADTSTLWVEADIRSRDWDAIKVASGDSVMVSTPSVDAPPQPATVYYVGREANPASGAIPLVAQISNLDGRYRPGLFARVTAPTTFIDDVITVPESALVDLDGRDAVFVEGYKGFQAVTVEVGRRSDGQVEICRGLEVGQSVVTEGAFILKSELLLEGEE
jgi:cobalt-zinc-cadmium efflux system membrane fusion protein